MAITNYAELQNALAVWTDRTDLSARLPEFIALAEAKLNRGLRVRQMQTSGTATMSSGTISLPSDWLAFESIWYTSGGMRYSLDNISVTDMNRFDDGGTGMPSAYYIAGETVTFYPEPDNDYSVAYVYYQKIPALTSTNTTNWLLTSHPDIYLYTSLLEAAPYLKDNEETQIWSSLMQGAIEQLKKSDRDKKSGGPMRMRAYA